MKFHGTISKVMVAVFLILLGGLTVINLITPSRDFSENENRYLQGFPKFSWERLVNGKFNAEFESYITDQFAFRDGWISIKTLSELAVGKQSSNGVYFAKDGYLIEMFDTVDQEQYSRNLDIITNFSSKVESSTGSRVSTLLVPTASLVLSNRLPASSPEIDQSTLLRQAEESLDGFVNVGPTLIDHNDEYIYYRTDHHWTSLGAFYAYTAWRSQIDMPVPQLSDFEQIPLSESFFGTTYSKTSLFTAPPDTITAFAPADNPIVSVDYNNGEEVSDTIYALSYLDKKDKYSVFLNANQPITRIHTTNKNGQKLLIIKDSYANTFAQMAVPDYEEIIVIDLRYYKLPVFDLIDVEEISDVLILYNLKGFAADTNLYYLTT